MKNIILLCLTLFLISGCGVVKTSQFYDHLEECPSLECMIDYVGYPSSKSIRENGNTVYEWFDRDVKVTPAHDTSSSTVPTSSHVNFSNGQYATIYSVRTVPGHHVEEKVDVKQCALWAEFTPSGKKVRFIRRGGFFDCRKAFSTGK